MHRRVAFLSALLVVCHSSFHVGVSASTQLYVATDGSDSNSGKSPSKALKTITKARDTIRGMKPLPAGGVVVNFAAGLYTREHGFPVEFTAEDSGMNEDTPIVLQGQAQATFSSGVQVPQDLFKPWDASPTKGVLVANLSTLGLSTADLGVMVSGGLKDCQHAKTQLFVADRPMVLARYPNIMPNGSWAFMQAAMGGQNQLVSSDPRVLRWVNESDPWTHGYWAWDWADGYAPIKSVKALNSSSAQVTLEGPGTIKTHARWYGVNLLSELDAPGEYYIDSASKLLYFLPPSSHWGTGAFLSLGDHVVRLNGTTNFQVRGLAIVHSQGTGLNITGADNVTVQNCVVSMHGNNGLSLDGKNSLVSNNEVSSVGCMALIATGGDGVMLTPGNLVVSGNYVHNFSEWKRTYQPGIFWAGVHNLYTNNTVSHGPHNGFLGGGNEGVGVDCTFTFNVVTHVCHEVSDAGAFYTCGQSDAFNNRGNVVAFNIFKDIRNTEPCPLAGGATIQSIYLDDQISGYSISGNTIVNSQTGILLGGGRRNVVVDNVFQEVDLAIHLDNRGMTWEKMQCVYPNGTSWNDLRRVGYLSPRWVDRWPEMAEIAVEHPCVPVYNVLAGNSWCGESFVDFTPKQQEEWLVFVSNNTKTC